MRYIGWRILTYRLAAEQSRHRVAVWRELRRMGALSLQSATWAVPPGSRFDEGLERAIRLVERSGGQALHFAVSASERTVGALEALYTAEREAEWAGFAAECDEARTLLQRAVETKESTPAELDEHEHHVDRLRRWHRELRAKDLFGAPSAQEAERRLKGCLELLAEGAERVHEAHERP